MSTERSQFGLRLFGLYFVFYAGFVLTAAFSPEILQSTPALGVNLAIWYGFALILVAIVLAVIYGWQCQSVLAKTKITETQGKSL